MKRVCLLMTAAIALASCGPPHSRLDDLAASDPRAKLEATDGYIKWFVESQSGDPKLADRLSADFRRGWLAMTRLEASGMKAAGIADSLREQGFNVVLLEPGVSSHQLPARTVSFLVLDQEAGCRQITYERWEALEPDRPTNMILVGMGRQDVTGVETFEKHIHLAAVELPTYEDYLEIRTASLSPLGKGIVLFGLVGLLSGCTDKAEPPPPPAPTATPTETATPEPTGGSQPGPTVAPEPPEPIGPPAPPRGTIRVRGRSTYRYPYGPGGRSIPVPLGPMPPKPSQFGRLVTYSLEVAFPAGTTECPNTLRQSLRDTVALADGTVLKDPPPDPPSDPGGFGSSRWAPDPRPDGVNPTTQINPDHTKSYIDTPGLAITSRNQLPARKDTVFRFELFDCHGTRLDCQVATYTLRIDRRGQITTQKMTDPQACQ
jgi:hypothetical protein